MRVEKHFAALALDMGLLIRKVAKTRNRSDAMAQTMQLHADSEEGSLKQSLCALSECFAALEDYRQVLVDRLEAKVHRPLLNFGAVCRKAKVGRDWVVVQVGRVVVQVGRDWVVVQGGEGLGGCTGGEGLGGCTGGEGLGGCTGGEGLGGCTGGEGLGGCTGGEGLGGCTGGEGLGGCTGGEGLGGCTGGEGLGGCTGGEGGCTR